MTRTVYDSTNPYDIPRTAEGVAGYVDGAYAWSQAGWDWHGAPLKIRITCTTADLSAHVADVEPGCLSAADAAAWAKAKVARGELPYLYFSLSRENEIIAALTAADLDFRNIGFWTAEWNGVPHFAGGASLTQYANPTFSGGHYDLSVAHDYLPGIDPPPAPPAPAPVPIPVPVPTPPPPTPAPTPSPAPVPPVDETRSAWARLAAFLTQDLPAAIAELLRLLGIFRKTP